MVARDRMPRTSTSALGARWRRSRREQLGIVQHHAPPRCLDAVQRCDRDPWGARRVRLSERDDAPWRVRGAGRQRRSDRTRGSPRRRLRRGGDGIPMTRRVAVVEDAVGPWSKGGRETRYAALLPRLARRGLDVEVFTMRWWSDPPDGDVRYTAISPLVPMYRGERRSILQATLFALSSLRLLRRDFDVILADQIPILHLFSLRMVARIKRVEARRPVARGLGARVLEELPRRRRCGRIDAGTRHGPPRRPDRRGVRGGQPGTPVDRRRRLVASSWCRTPSTSRGSTRWRRRIGARSSSRWAGSSRTSGSTRRSASPDTFATPVDPPASSSSGRDPSARASSAWSPSLRLEESVEFLGTLDDRGGRLVVAARLGRLRLPV